MVNLAVQLPVVVLTAIVTVQFANRAQEDREREYVERLETAVRSEAELNARKIREWVPGLLRIAEDLERFVNDKGATRPSVEPGYGGLTNAAFEALVESPVAARHILPCVHTALATARYRLSEGNSVKRELDVALVEYTATFPGALAEGHSSAARLHARIEQLVMIYKDLPDALDKLIEFVDLQDCGVGGGD